MEEELEGPFKWPWSVCRRRCVYCGNVKEIDWETAQHYLKAMAALGNAPEIPLSPINLKDYYFEVSYCNSCGPKEEVGVRLREIKRAEL